jgi:hypothetical protein
MSTITAPGFPATLRTVTPAEGHALARQLAERALAERTHFTRDVAAHLSSPSVPSLEALTAVYFQTVAAANQGWQQ